MNKKHQRSVGYHDDLIDELKDHEEAIAYLNAALEESLAGDKESQEVLLKALRNVAEAQGVLENLLKKLICAGKFYTGFYHQGVIQNSVPSPV